MKTVKSLLAIILLFAASTAYAGFGDTDYDDESRAFNFTVPAWNDTATSGGLDSGGSDDVIVNDFDVFTGTPTAVTPASVNTIKGCRTLALKLDENSGSTLAGYVTITGRNQFNQYVSERIYFGGGDMYALTQNAFIGKPAIALDLDNAASGDVLRVGVYEFGIPVYASSLTAVVIGNDGGSTSSSIDSGTWDSTYSTYLPGTLYAGNLIQFIGFSDKVGTPRPSKTTVTATASGF